MKPQDHIDQWAHDHAHSDRLEQFVYQSRPHFDSARQFGAFAGVVIEQWQHGTPGVNSWMAGVLEVVEMGALVQTSPNPKRISNPPIYHLSWMGQLLERASNASSRDIIQAWGQKDILGRPYRPIADDFGLSHSVIHKRVAVGRQTIYRELVLEGLADREPKGNRRKNTRSMRMTC